MKDYQDDSKVNLGAVYTTNARGERVFSHYDKFGGKVSPKLLSAARAEVGSGRGPQMENYWGKWHGRVERNVWLPERDEFNEAYARAWAALSPACGSSPCNFFAQHLMRTAWDELNPRGYHIGWTDLSDPSEGNDKLLQYAEATSNLMKDLSYSDVFYTWKWDENRVARNIDRTRGVLVRHYPAWFNVGDRLWHEEVLSTRSPEYAARRKVKIFVMLTCGHIAVISDSEFLKTPVVDHEILYMPEQYPNTAKPTTFRMAGSSWKSHSATFYTSKGGWCSWSNKYATWACLDLKWRIVSKLDSRSFYLEGVKNGKVHVRYILPWRILAAFSKDVLKSASGLVDKVKSVLKTFNPELLNESDGYLSDSSLRLIGLYMSGLHDIREDKFRDTDNVLIDYELAKKRSSTPILVSFEFFSLC